jgi:8-oxo-dGTP pyrophosphatase MutT (NUDIX family)
LSGFILISGISYQVVQTERKGGGEVISQRPQAVERLLNSDSGPELPISISKLKGEIDRSKGGHKRVLSQVLRKLGIGRTKFYEEVAADSVLWRSESVIDQIFRIIDGTNGRVAARAAEPRKRRATIFPDDYITTVLPSGNAERGEIEIVVQSGENLIKPDSHAGVAPYVAVYVDKVRFFQRDKLTGERYVAPGDYIRIEVPSEIGKAKKNGGAVSLPVCVASREVMLVAQFRHPQRAFMVEAPRGFPNAVLDAGAADTAKRETREETGLHVEDPRQHCLRSLYTDTGKLAEKPSYYLQYVDRDAFQREFLSRSSVMQAPAWIPLHDFYESIFSEEPIALSRELFDEAFLRAHRAWLDGLSDLDENRLHIQDAFTVTAGLLAIPHLISKMPELACWARFR